MKRCFLLSALCVAFSILLPYLFPGSAPPPEEPVPSEIPERMDARETIRLLSGGAVRTITLRDYLPGVVAAEMPASFAPEALRAQAVAARTYTLYRKRNGRSRHSEADLCDDPGCCQAWLDAPALEERWGEDFGSWSAVIEGAAADTDGVILTWEAEPILACFHAASPGSTESSAALWGTALPYLVSVTSPETAADVPGFVSTVELTPGELRAGILSLAPGAALGGPPESWVGERRTDDSGRVASLRVGGVKLTGEALRRQFGLRSTAFSLAWTGEAFRFTVAGHGHGVGMSQYGAEVMARDGSSWREILRHYYPGASISRAS